MEILVNNYITKFYFAPPSPHTPFPPLEHHRLCSALSDRCHDDADAALHDQAAKLVQQSKSSFCKNRTNERQ